MLLAQIYDAKVVDASPTTLLLQVTGTEERINGLLAMMRPFGIRELARTGPLAMMRGGGSISPKNRGVDRGDGAMAAD
jgi:acetolactate synthase-1/3 small subunit